jgi:hypothetical protein
MITPYLCATSDKVLVVFGFVHASAFLLPFITLCRFVRQRTLMAGTLLGNFRGGWTNADLKNV